MLNIEQTKSKLENISDVFITNCVNFRYNNQAVKVEFSLGTTLVWVYREYEYNGGFEVFYTESLADIALEELYITFARSQLGKGTL